MTRKFAFVIAASITFGATMSMMSTSALAVTVDDIVAACDEYGMVMVHTGLRLFHH